MGKIEGKEAPKEAKKEVVEAEGKGREYLEDLQRLQAEFENFKKRLEREKEEFVFFANCELIKGLLPVLDSIDSALESVKGDEKAVEGISLIRKQLMQALERHGVKEIQCRKGDCFNPGTQQCLAQGSEKGLKEGAILEQLQKGYFLKDKVLRPAMVKINRIGGEVKK